MRNPQKLATLGRQDTRRRKKKKKQKSKQKRNTTQYVLDTAMHKQTHIT